MKILFHLSVSISSNSLVTNWAGPTLGLTGVWVYWEAWFLGSALRVVFKLAVATLSQFKTMLLFQHLLISPVNNILITVPARYSNTFNIKRGKSTHARTHTKSIFVQWHKTKFYPKTQPHLYETVKIGTLDSKFLVHDHVWGIQHLFQLNNCASYRLLVLCVHYLQQGYQNIS